VLVHQNAKRHEPYHEPLTDQVVRGPASTNRESPSRSAGWRDRCAGWFARARTRLKRADVGRMATPAWVTVILIIGVSGCGDSTSTTGPTAIQLHQADAVAKRHLKLAYHYANRAVMQHVTCQVPVVQRPCEHPKAYPAPRLLVAVVGQRLLHLKMSLASGTDGVAADGRTYVVAGQTSARAVSLAEGTPYGTVWVLQGSPRGRYRLSKLTHN
jgi:hypothetical protein